MKVFNLNLHYYFHPPVGGFSRGLRPDAITNVASENGVVIVKSREFFSFTTWFLHYKNEFKNRTKKKLFELTNELLSKLSIPVLKKTTSGHFVWATVAFDAVGSGSNIAGASSGTWTHTCSGSNRYFVAGVASSHNTSPTITSITYNAISTTRQAHSTNSSLADVWGLLAPTTGSNTVAITWGAGSDWVANSISFTGVAQTSSVNVSGTASGISGTASISLTTTVPNTVIVETTSSQGSGAGVGSTSSQTLAWSDDRTSVAHGGGAYGLFASAGSNTITRTLTGSTGWDIAAIALAPAPTQSGGTLSLMGMG